MNRRQLEEAIAEAERFLKKAKKQHKDAQDKHHASDSRLSDEKFPSWSSGPGNADVLRASLDLTRTLAEMRKAKYA